MHIRPIKQEELLLLTEFLYEAIHQTDRANPVPRTILQSPSLWSYIDRFGSQKDDHCLVAEEDGIIVGAIWVRCIKSYGYIADHVPEIVISVYPQYRKKGIGTALLAAMLNLLSEKGYPQTSLSVQKDNDAVSMYRKAGFQIYKETQQEYIMTYDFTNHITI